MPDYNDIYWQKVQNGELWLQKCGCCNRYIFYPRSLCPYCWEKELSWVKAGGRGRIHSYTVVRVSALPEFEDETPYLYAMIELDEGIRMPGTVIGGLDEVYPDMPVQVKIISKNGQDLPVFEPVREK